MSDARVCRCCKGTVCTCDETCQFISCQVERMQVRAGPLRVVPVDPDPAAYPPVPWACHVAPARCHACNLAQCIRFSQRPAAFIPLKEEETR